MAHGSAVVTVILEVDTNREAPVMSSLEPARLYCRFIICARKSLDKKLQIRSLGSAACALHDRLNPIF